MPTPSRTGWMPGAEQRPSPNFTPGHEGRRAVVAHITDGGFQGSLDWLTNAASNVSSHFLISKTGRIVQLVSILDTAWTNGLIWKQNRWWSPDGKRQVNPTWYRIIPGKNPNGYTITIEHELMRGEAWPEPLIEASGRVLRWIRQQTGLDYVLRDSLIGHSAINPIDRPYCPGPQTPWDRLAALGNQGNDDPFARWGAAGHPIGDHQRPWATAQLWLKNLDLGAALTDHLYFGAPIGQRTLVVFENGIIYQRDNQEPRLVRY